MKHIKVIGVLAITTHSLVITVTVNSFTLLQSEVNDSFLRSAREGNLQLVLEHLDYGQADVNTCNQVRH